MKNIFFLCCLLGLQVANGQGNQNTVEITRDTLAVAEDKDTFWDKVTISESMETSEQIAEPAQFQFTFPKDGTESYVINLGASYRLNARSRFISRIKTEFHKNTLLEKEQENLDLGYQATLGMPFTKGFLFLLFDPKYVYNGIEHKSAAAGNILFTLKNYKSSFFKLNTNNRITNCINFVPSLFAGLQLQSNFKAKEEINEGFIMRPIFSCSASFYLNKSNENKDGIVKASVIYTGRQDIINDTDTEKEGYTDLLKAKAEVFLINAPVRVSIGVSFNKGSDPIKGLTEQEYWLLSLNFLK